MIIPTEKIYEGLPVRALNPSLMRFRAVATGDITDVSLWVDSVSSFSGDWYFNLKINGVGVWSGTSRLLVTSGDLSPTKTGESIAVAEGDDIELALEAKGSGTMNVPITLLIQTDDGTGAGDPTAVHITGDESIDGVKTFTSSPVIPDPSGDQDAASKAYVDAAVVAGGGYNDEQAQDAVGSILDDSGDIDFTYDDATPKITATIKSSVVNLSKIVDIAANSIMGNNTGSAAAPSALSVSQVRTLLGIADAMTYKGVIDCSANPNYPAADAGDVYKVSVAGKIGGASGLNVEAGDTLLCTADSTASGDHATVGASWDILQVNIDGAVIGPASSTSGNIATFNGTSGKTIQDGGKALPSGSILGTTDTQTLTNKRVTPRVGTTASSSTPTPDADAHDIYTVTALAAGATFGAPTGTPTDGQSLIIRIKDNGTARTLAFNAIYRAIGVTLPTTTVISKTLYLGMIYNSADSKWDVLGVCLEA